MHGGTSLTILPSEGPVMVDEYNGSLTQNHLETITMKSFRAVQDNAVLETVGDVNTVPTASVVDPGAMVVVAVDQAGTADTTEVNLTEPSSPNIFGIRAASTEIPVTDETNAGTVQPAPKYKRDQVFQTFSADKTVEEDGVVQLRAEIVGIAGYKAAVAGSNNDTPDDAIDDVLAAAGEEGLVSNPVVRVDFYALVGLKNKIGVTPPENQVPPVVEPATVADAEALKLIASVSAAGAEDFMHGNETDADADDDYAARKYVWGADVSAAEVLAAIGSKAETVMVQFIAVAVNSDGVAIIDAADGDSVATGVQPTAVSSR